MALVSCEKNERGSGPTIINTWTEIEPVGILQYAGSNYSKLQIKVDSTFQLTYDIWGDIIISGDPCGISYTNYVKGVCTTSGDEIFFSGCYTDPTFAGCLSNCSGQTNYNAHYRYAITEDSLIFNPGSEWNSRRDMLPK